jgi:hypothetical protein
MLLNLICSFHSSEDQYCGLVRYDTVLTCLGSAVLQFKGRIGQFGTLKGFELGKHRSSSRSNDHSVSGMLKVELEPYVET